MPAHNEYQWELRSDGQKYYTRPLPCTCHIGTTHWALEEDTKNG